MTFLIKVGGHEAVPLSQVKRVVFKTFESGDPILQTEMPDGSFLTPILDLENITELADALSVLLETLGEFGYVEVGEA